MPVKEAKIIYQSEAESVEINFWKNISFEEKVSIVQVLREQYMNLFNKKDEYAESRKRLRRVYRVIKLNKIKYMIVGAYAFALYAMPRNTRDIDE